MNLTIDQRILDCIAKGAIVYCNHSGGKDSQAMYALLSSIVPMSQLVVVHADLGEVEWHGVKDHIRSTIEHHLHVVKAVWADGSPKDLLGMVERRFEQRPQSPSWPSSSARFCTSDLKRDPVAKFIRHDMRQRGKRIAINAMGLRAEESSARAKKATWSTNTRLTNGERTVYEWLPIHDWTTTEVFDYIFAAGQEPFWAYQQGNERLSCVLCILGSRNDIQHGARQRPELVEKYLELEQRTGYTMFHKESLAQRAGLIATDGG